MIRQELQVSLFLSLMVSWGSGQGCKLVQLTGNHGTFTSPNYPRRYDHKANCTWTITAPEGHFVHIVFDEFDVKNPFWECDNDYISVIYDAKRKEKFCNDEKPPEVLKSTSPSITLKLISDHFFLNGVGFSATYDVVDKYGNKLPEREEMGSNEELFPATRKKITTTIADKHLTMMTKRPTTAPEIISTSVKLSAGTPTFSKHFSRLVKVTAVASTLGQERSSLMPGQNTGETGDNISKNPGAMSGLVLGAIIGMVLIGVVVILLFVLVRYRRNKNKRINLSVIETSDDKELITEEKFYKKQGKHSVRVPEAEAFPL